MRHCASRVMNLPVRVAAPENLTGLADKLTTPAYATAVGLLKFAHRLDQLDAAMGSPGASRRPRRDGPAVGKIITDFLGRLLPD
jgi:cell division protein FtsA